MKKELIYLTPYLAAFEHNYLKVREKEGRVYSDETVLKLPFIGREHSQFLEWSLRAKTLNRFIKYLKGNSYTSVLDIGCGNGWFSNHIANAISGKVIGLDVNKEELEQGNRVFKAENLSFAYGDIFEAEFDQKFDLIVMNASIQYFPDLKLLLNRLKSLLSPFGEIHILDSPFYYNEEACIKAKARTNNYYKSLGYPEMSQFYFHHQISQLNNFKLIYKYSTNPFQKILKGKDSPFNWYYFN